MEPNNDRVRLRALVYRRILQSSTMRQYASNADYVWEVVKSLCFGDIRIRCL